MKEVESWLLKNAVFFGFLAKQALLTVYLLTLMELLQTAEDQGTTKIYPSPEHNYMFQQAFAILLSLGRIWKQSNFPFLMTTFRG